MSSVCCMLLEWKNPTASSSSIFMFCMCMHREHRFSFTWAKSNIFISTTWENTLVAKFNTPRGLQIKVTADFHCLTREVPMPSSNSKYLHTNPASARLCLPARWQPLSRYVRPPCLPAAFLSCVSRLILLVIFSKVGCEECSGSAYCMHSDTNQILVVYAARARRVARHPARPPPPRAPPGLCLARTFNRAEMMTSTRWVKTAHPLAFRCCGYTVLVVVYVSCSCISHRARGETKRSWMNWGSRHIDLFTQFNCVSFNCLQKKI